MVKAALVAALQAIVLSDSRMAILKTSKFEMGKLEI